MLQVLKKDWTALETNRWEVLLHGQGSVLELTVFSRRQRKRVGMMFQPGIRAVLVLATEPAATLLVSE